MIDGYGRFNIFRKVVLPLVLPGIATTSVFCIIWSWNEFLFAFLFSRKVATTVTVLISSFWGSIDVQYGTMAAGAAISILPTLIAAWFMPVSYTHLDVYKRQKHGSPGCTNSCDS